MKKRKTPKTYLGKSKKTLSDRDKAFKVLASQGFHDVFTFKALKERAASSHRGGLEENKGIGLGLGTGASTLPGPADWVLEESGMLTPAQVPVVLQGGSLVEGGGLRTLKTNLNANVPGTC